MANPFKRKSADPVAEAETKVQELRERAGALQAQRQRVAAKRDAAVADRKAALLDDDALDKVGFTIASLDAQLSGLGDAVAENQVAIGEAESVLSLAIDRRDREAKAAQLDRLADTIETLCTEHAAVVAKLNAAHGEAIAITPAVSLVPLNQLIGTLNMANGPAYEAAVANLRSAAQLLRNPPVPPSPAPMPPQEQIGEVSPYRRRFEHDVAPGAIGDRRPMVYDAFAEK